MSLSSNKSKVKAKNPFLMPIKYPEYGKLWFAQLVNNIGNQFTFLALQFLVFSLTHSTVAMGILAIFQVLPMILIGPYAGVVIDRIDRKRLMVVSNIVNAIWLVLIPLSAVVSYRVEAIYVLAFCMGLTTRFFLPSRSASIPKLVDKSDLLSANSLSAATFQVSALIGPVTAGLLTAKFGYDIAFYIDMTGFLISAGLIFLIRIDLRPGMESDFMNKKPYQKTNTKKSTVKGDLIESFVFLKNFPAMTFIIAIFGLLLFSFGAVIVLMVPYLYEIPLTSFISSPEEAFGVMGSIAAIMGLFVSVVLGSRPHLSYPASLITLCSLIAAFIMIGFVFATDFYTLAFFWMWFGMIQVFVMIPFQTISQETIPDLLRGKVISFFNIIITVAQILGMALGGFIAELSTIHMTFMIFGLILLLSSIVFFILLFVKKFEMRLNLRRELYYNVVEN